MYALNCSNFDAVVARLTENSYKQFRWRHNRLSECIQIGTQSRGLQNSRLPKSSRTNFCSQQPQPWPSREFKTQIPRIIRYMAATINHAMFPHTTCIDVSRLTTNTPQHQVNAEDFRTEPPATVLTCYQNRGTSSAIRAAWSLAVRSSPIPSRSMKD